MADNAEPLAALPAARPQRRGAVPAHAEARPAGGDPRHARARGLRHALPSAVVAAGPERRAAPARGAEQSAPGHPRAGSARPDSRSQRRRARDERPGPCGPDLVIRPAEAARRAFARDPCARPGPRASGQPDRRRDQAASARPAHADQDQGQREPGSGLLPRGEGRGLPGRPDRAGLPALLPQSGACRARARLRRARSRRSS